MKQFLRKLWKDEEGAELVEWIIIVATLSIAAIAAFTLLGGVINQAVDTVATTVSEAVNQ